MDSALVMAGEEGCVDHADERTKFIHWNDRQLTCQMAIPSYDRKHTAYPARLIVLFSRSVHLQ
jgi:hypothetical protein